MKLNRRLLPIYIGFFAQGLVFWYAIEKLFMMSIGFNTFLIGVMIAIYSTITLLTEIPSGILADRWSRRGVLILSSLALAASSLIGALSNNVAIYLISSSFWGLYLSLSSGVTESIVYDLLIETGETKDNYEKYIARVNISSSLALIIGGLTGSVIGQYLGLDKAYLLSIPASLISILFFAIFKEPKEHLKSQEASLLKHTKETFAIIASNINLIQLSLMLILSGMILSIFMEASQLWLIAIIAPIVFYGPLNAAVCSSYGLSGILSNYVKSKKRLVIALVISLIVLIVLIFTRNVFYIIFAITVISIIIQSIDIVILHKINNYLPSKTRAGSISVMSAAKRLTIIPISLLFGSLASAFGIFSSTWFIVIIMIVIIITILFVQDKS